MLFRLPFHSLSRALSSVAASALALACLTGSAMGQEVAFCFTADGTQEVPPTPSAATAEAYVVLNTQTNIVSWHITHTGLTGNHNASHFHKAPVGQNGPIQVNIGTGNPIVGSAPISPSQANDLLNGEWYLNLHTGGFGSGEIRGQVTGDCFDVHCTSLANSFSANGARLTTQGDIVASNNAMSFMATGVPPGEFGFLLLSQGNGQFMPAGSAGIICLTGSTIGRFNGQILVSQANGDLGPFTPDILNLPAPLGGSILAGETWCFQDWFRDGSTSNFTDGINVTFL